MPTHVATIILAGGQGTRLHPLTMHHAKPAVSYGGKYRLIDIPISNAVNSDFREIFVIVQYLGNELEHYISEAYRFDPFYPGSIHVLSPQENATGEKEWFKGTADAVRQNLPHFLKSPAEYFLILSGDQLYNIDFRSMLEVAQQRNADLTIASLPVKEKEAKRMGVIQADQNGKIISFVEKPKNADILRPYQLSTSTYQEWNITDPGEPTYLGSMGIYIFKRAALISLLSEDLRDDFGYHLIATAVQNYRTHTHIYRGYWEDIGTVASYYEANLMLTEEKGGLITSDQSHPIYSKPYFLPGPKMCCTKIHQSIVCEGCTIEAAEISHSIIGIRSNIQEGTVIRDSVIMGNHEGTSNNSSCGIGKNCIIEKAIIDENVSIGDNVHLTNANKLERYDGDGIFIRDGIVIVTQGAKLPNHFVL